MIPYLELPSLQLPVLGLIHPYGVTVGLGAIVSFWTVFLKARRAGIPDSAINAALAWSVAAALIGAHLAYLVFAEPGGRLTEIGVPALLRLWDGTSSLGGIAVAQSIDLGSAAAADALGAHFLRHSQDANQLVLGHAQPDSFVADRFQSQVPQNKGP